jgi:hypothetical protein
VTTPVKGLVALAVAAACGAAVALVVRGAPAPAAPHPPPVGTVGVVRTDLASTVLTAASLGYLPSPPVIDQMTGTYTGLLSPGSVVQPGQILFRVDDQPAVLMSGAVPAWRAFTPGMADGPDVEELESDLIALGDAHGLLDAPDQHYGPAAVAAVERWQAALGSPLTGTVPLGAIAFLPTAVRIDSATVSLGQPASPGDAPYDVTTTTRAVSVPLTPSDPAVATGQAVTIVLPSGTTTPGMVTAQGPPAPDAAGSGGSSSTPSSSSTSSPSSSTSSTSSSPTLLTVTPDDPAATGTADGEAVQVSLTVQSVQHVLAVPVSALLALAGGGYGLEVVSSSSARHHLVGVHTGVFAGGDVEVSGAGLRPGQRVVVAQ